MVFFGNKGSAGSLADGFHEGHLHGEKGRPKWVRIAGRAALVLALLPVLMLLLLRWVPPPASALMAQRKLAGSAIDYRWVSLDEIAPAAVVAVVAAEDQKFADHRGFDREAIQEALDDRDRGKRLRGASTITQQLAKNLFLWPGRSWVRKGLEAGWTASMEVAWPKRRIVELYLNVVEFGDGVFGVESASQRYFGKPAKRLTSSEAALLAAVLPNPYRLRAAAPSAYVRQRQQWILRQMGQLGGESYVVRLE